MLLQAIRARRLAGIAGGGRRFPELFAPLLAACLSAAPLFGAQERLDGERYRELLAETRGGLFITSGRALGALPGDSVERVVREFIAAEPEPVWLQAAALLHTEAAFRAAREADRHLGFARDLLFALPDPGERASWLRRWWLAIGYSYQVALNSVAGVAAFEEALVDFPGDREIREALARMLQMVGRQREETPYLRRARELFAGLVEESPGDPDLRVRLAVVLVDLGRPEEAALQLERTAGMRLPALTRLVASLALGEIELGRGKFAEAEAAFAEAARRARRSPAVVSGLVAARLGRGDRAGAREAAATLLRRPATSWEPEWRYWLGPALEFEAMFQAMKDGVRETGSR